MRVTAVAREVAACLGLAVGLLALVGLVPCAHALDPERSITQYARGVWRAPLSLPHDSVTAIVQRRDGYLWLGTIEGLARFDGVRSVVFDKSNTPAFADQLGEGTPGGPGRPEPDRDLERWHVCREVALFGHLIRAGAPLTYVRDLMGHSSITVTADVYARHLPTGDRHYLDRLDRESGSSAVAAGGETWSRRSGLNRGPAGYEPTAAVGLQRPASSSGRTLSADANRPIAWPVADSCGESSATPRVRDDVSPVQYLHQAGLLDRHHAEALVSGEAEQKPEEVVA